MAGQQQAVDSDGLDPKFVQILRNVGVGRRPMDDPFFQHSYNTCKVFQRLGVTANDEEELCHDVIKEFPCYATGCKAVFKTLVDFEMHYNAKHRYICTECKKTLPSPRILDIHIQETHDSFFQVLSSKQPMYQCLDSECNQKFSNPFERREHCLTVHKYPKHFRFDNTRFWNSNKDSNKMDCEEMETDTSGKPTLKPKKVNLNKNQRTRMFYQTKSVPITKTDTVTPVNPVPPEVSSSALAFATVTPMNTVPPKVSSSALAFVPRQVQKSYTKALTKHQSNPQNVLETKCMSDLMDSLPE